MHGSDAILDDRFLLGKGAHRSTYLHPDDASKLIKIVHEGGKERASNRKRYWSMGRRLDMDGNERELRSIRLLQSVDSYDTRFFPEFFGSIDTNLGLGLVFEKFGSGPGEGIYELKNPAQRNAAFKLLPKEKILEQFEELLGLFMKIGIPSVGLAVENVGILDRPGQRPQLVCYDLKFLEDRGLFPLADWFPLLYQRRVKRILKRRSKKFSAKIGGDLQPAGQK
ncbi:MAG: YrbL family protein [Hyphomicrobiales bacterium]